MLKKIFFLLLIAGNQIIATQPLEEKLPQATYLSTNQTNSLSPAQTTALQVFLAAGAIGIGIDLGLFTISHLLPTKTHPAIKTAFFVAIASTGALIMAPTKDQIDLITKTYNNWRHKN